MPTIHPQLRDSELRGLNKELERQGRKESEVGKWTGYTQMPGPPLTHPDTLHSCLADAPTQACGKIKVNKGLSRRAWTGFPDPSLHSIPLKGNVSVSEQWPCTLACEGESGRASAGQSSAL